MAKFLFGMKPKKQSPPKKRLISAKRLRSRRQKVSDWANVVIKCNEHIAKFDQLINQNSGTFIGAKKEKLLAKRLEWVGRRDVAQAHLNHEKSLFGRNIQHNKQLTVSRLSGDENL